MSVTSVKPFANTQGGVDQEGTQTYTNVYHVYTNDKDDAADTVRDSAAVALGLPDYNDSWAWGNDANPYALAKSRQANLVSSNESTPYYRKWEVTVGYTTAGQLRDSSGGGGSGSGAEEGVQDPVDEQWQISGSYVQTTERTSVDKDGKRMTNSSEEEKHTDRPSGYDTLMMSGNTNTINLAVRSNAVMKCNEAGMWGLAARQVYLNQWVYKIHYRGTTAYVSHQLEWWIARPYDPVTKTGLWNFTYVDEGTREKISDDPDPKLRYKPILVRDMPTTLPLDGLGAILDLAANPEGIRITKKVIYEYDFLTNMTFLPDPIPGPFV